MPAMCSKSSRLLSFKNQAFVIKGCERLETTLDANPNWKRKRSFSNSSKCEIRFRESHTNFIRKTKKCVEQRVQLYIRRKKSVEILVRSKTCLHLFFAPRSLNIKLDNRLSRKLSQNLFSSLLICQTPLSRAIYNST
jgi:hypothetical protein